MLYILCMETTLSYTLPQSGVSPQIFYFFILFYSFLEFNNYPESVSTPAKLKRNQNMKDNFLQVRNAVRQRVKLRNGGCTFKCLRREIEGTAHSWKKLPKSS